jgi:hypothetical protein
MGLSWWIRGLDVGRGEEVESYLVGCESRIYPSLGLVGGAWSEEI